MKRGNVCACPVESADARACFGGSACGHPAKRCHVCVQVLRFLGWLHEHRRVTASNLCSVFSSPQLGTCVQSYVQHLVVNGRSYGTAAGYVSSLLNVTKFVHAARRIQAGHDTSVDGSAVDQLASLLRQCKQQSEKDGKFKAVQGSAAKANWLDWYVSRQFSLV